MGIMFFDDFPVNGEEAAEEKGIKYSHEQHYNSRQARTHSDLAEEDQFSTEDVLESGLVSRQPAPYGDER